MHNAHAYADTYRSALSWCTHTRAHNIVWIWAYSALLKASARGGWEIGHPDNQRQQHRPVFDQKPKGCLRAARVPRLLRACHILDDPKSTATATAKYLCKLDTTLIKKYEQETTVDERLQYARCHSKFSVIFSTIQYQHNYCELMEFAAFQTFKVCLTLARLTQFTTEVVYNSQ